MELIDNLEKTLFEEKGLFDIFRKSWNLSSRWHDNISRLIIISFLVFIAYTIYTTPAHSKIVSGIIFNWSNISFSYATSILGFLIAGFTIFATLPKAEIFLALSMVDYRPGMSQLKFIFFNFLKVLINHIILLAVSIIITMSKDFSAPIYDITIEIYPSAREYFHIVPYFTLVLIGYMLLSSIIYLKTFVWKLYQSIILTIAASAQSEIENIDD